MGLYTVCHAQRAAHGNVKILDFPQKSALPVESFGVF
jgi:hypothetical protein